MNSAPQSKVPHTLQWTHIAKDPIMSHVSIHVYCAYHSIFGTEWVGELTHSHYNRLYYIEAGEAMLHTEESHVPLRPGCAYLIPDTLPHRHECDAGIEMYWCHFNASIDGTQQLFGELSIPLETRLKQKSHYRETFKRLIRKAVEREPWSHLERTALLLQLIHPHLRESKPISVEATQRRKRLLPALRHIDQNLTKRLRITELSNLLGLNVEYFSRAFRREFGISPKRYMLQRRIQHAQRLLCSTDMQVQEIAEHCGFNDPYHFSKTFKLITGVAPIDYRRLEKH